MSGGLDIFLESAFRIRRGEAARAGLMFLYQLAIVANFIVGRTVRDTLFLSRYPLNRLPLMYVGVALSVAVCSYAYSRFADKHRRDKVIVASLILSGMSLLLAWIGVVTGIAGKWLYPSLYLLVEIIGALSMIQFWTFANDIFSSREAKRLFAFIGAGGVIASIVCGFGVGSSAEKIGAQNLILIATGLLALAAGCVISLAKICRGELAVTAHRTGKKERKLSAAPTLATKHLRLIAGIVALTMLTSTVVDYQFKVIAQQSFRGQEATLAAFFGYFYGFAGIISCVVQFFAIGRLLERAGIVWALLILPLGLLSGATAMILVPLLPALFAATLAKGAENVFRYTVNDATMQLLYVPVAAQQRARAKAFIDGIIKPVSVGASGLVILALSRIAAADGQALNFALEIAWVDMVLIVGWITFVIAVRRSYVTSLLGTLRARRLDFDNPFSLAADEGSVRVLEQALASNRETDILHALELLPSLSVDLTTKLRPLITHSSQTVRVACLALLGKSGRYDHLELIRTRFADLDPEVRAAALEAYCAVGRERAVRAVVPFLKDRSALVRGAAVAGLIKHGGLDGVLASAETLKKLLSDGDHSARLQGARVLEEARVQSFHGPVLELMQDQILEVQLAAIRAAAAIKSPELAPSLIYKLANPRTSRAAGRALEAYGDRIENLLFKVLRNKDEDPAIRRQIPRILSHIGGPKTLTALLGELDTGDEALLKQIARSAARLRERSPDAIIDDRRLIEATRRQIRDSYQSLAIVADLGLGSDNLLAEALTLKHERKLALAFRLLSIRFSPRTIELIYSNLESHSKATRANAVEVVDNILPKDEARLLLPLLEEHDLPSRVRAGESLFQLQRKNRDSWLAELVRDPDPWIASCALYQLGQAPAEGCEAWVVERFSPGEPLVLETACRVLARLWSNGATPDPALFDRAMKLVTIPPPIADAALKSALDILRDTLEKKTVHG